MAELDFRDLLDRAIGGEEGAWRILAPAFSALVLGIVRSYRLGDADASDICQHIWLKLLQWPTGLRDPARLPSWLATTARRHALHLLDARRREIPGPHPEWADPAPLPEQELLAAERERVLWRAVEHLPDRHRDLIHLLCGDDRLTHAEIAAKLGIQAGSVGPLRRRALDGLRRALEKQGYDHP